MKIVKLAAAATLAATPLMAGAAHASDRSDAQAQVNQSHAVIQHMEQDPHMRGLLQRSKGVLVVPRFGQGGLVVGARGGEGVLLAHQNGHWSEPAFYNLGGISIGAQAGGAGGSIAYILMTQNALNDMMGSNNFSLNANSGLSIVNYSAKAQAAWGKSDVVVWSDVKGAYAGATIGATNIAEDKDQNKAYYGQQATVNQILKSQVHNAGAKSLVSSLPG